MIVQYRCLVVLLIWRQMYSKRTSCANSIKKTIVKYYIVYLQHRSYISTHNFFFMVSESLLVNTVVQYCSRKSTITSIMPLSIVNFFGNNFFLEWKNWKLVEFIELLHARIRYLFSVPNAEQISGKFIKILNTQKFTIIVMMVSICFVLEFLQVFLEKKKKPNTQNFNADYEVGYFLIFHVN